MTQIQDRSFLKQQEGIRHTKGKEERSMEEVNRFSLNYFRCVSLSANADSKIPSTNGRPYHGSRMLLSLKAQECKPALTYGTGVQVRGKVCHLRQQPGSLPPARVPCPAPPPPPQGDSRDPPLPCLCQHGKQTHSTLLRGTHTGLWDFPAGS